MLLTRDEMRFDFGGHKLDPVRDRDTIAWAVQQFLFGEVTGIQVGHWIYQAPDLESARFLSKQALEEFQHVGNFLRILEILGVPPGPAHPLLRHLTAISSTWEEHVALEMAVGEGLVLQAFYAMIELVDHEEITSILKRGVRQEEGHVDFGERRTMRAIEGRPWLRRRLLGLAIVNLWAIRRFARFMEKRLPAHPAAAQLPAFLAHIVGAAETRLLRMGVLDRPFAKLSTKGRALLVVEAYAGKAGSAALSLVTWPFRLLPWFSAKRLTDTYLDDPEVKRVGALAEHAGETEEPEHVGAE